MYDAREVISLKTTSNTFERLSSCELLKIATQVDVNKTYVK